MFRSASAFILLCCLVVPFVAAGAGLRAQSSERRLSGRGGWIAGPHKDEASQSVTSTEETPDTVATQPSLVELEAMTQTGAKFEEVITAIAVEALNLPGVSQLTTAVGKFLSSTAVKTTFLGLNRSSLKYSRVLIEKGVAALQATIMTVVTCILTLNVPGLLVSLPLLAAKVTTLVVSWMRLKKLEAGMELQGQMCSTISPLLVEKDDWVQMNKNLGRAAAKTSALQKIARMLLKKENLKRLTDGECYEAMVQFSILTDTDVPSLKPVVVCQFAKTRILNTIAAQKRAIYRNIEVAKASIGQINDQIREWGASFKKRITEWESASRGMSDESLSGIVKLAHAVDEFVSWCIRNLKQWIGSAYAWVTGARSSPGGPARATPRLATGDEVTRWSPSRRTFVTVTRTHERSRAFGSSKDSVLYDNSVDDIHNAMSLTLDMVLSSASNPYHMALDRSRIEVLGVATINVHPKLKGALPYTGPVLLQPIPTGSGWQLKIATPKPHSDAECIDDRVLYAYRKRYRQQITETFCRETSSMIASEALSSPGMMLREEIRVQYKGIRLMSRIAPLSDYRVLNLFSVVPSFSLASIGSEVARDLDEMQLGREGSEYCVSLFEARSEGGWFWGGVSTAGFGEQYRKKVRLSLPSGMSDAEFAFSSLGTEKLQLCSNNAAEAMVWFCAMVNIGVEMPGLAERTDKAMLFVGEEPVMPEFSLAENFEMGSVYVGQKTRAAGGRRDIREEYCSETASITASQANPTRSISHSADSSPAASGALEPSSGARGAAASAAAPAAADASDMMLQQVVATARKLVAEGEVDEVLGTISGRTGVRLGLDVADMGVVGEDGDDEDVDDEDDLVAQAIRNAEHSLAEADARYNDLVEETERTEKYSPDLVSQLIEAAQQSVDDAEEAAATSDACVKALADVLSNSSATPHDKADAEEVFQRCLRQL